MLQSALAVPDIPRLLILLIFLKKKEEEKVFKSHGCLMGRRKKVAWEAATKGRVSHTVGSSTARLLGGSGHVLSSKRKDVELDPLP